MSKEPKRGYGQKLAEPLCGVERSTEGLRRRAQDTDIEKSNIHISAQEIRTEVISAALGARRTAERSFIKGLSEYVVVYPSVAIVPLCNIECVHFRSHIFTCVQFHISYVFDFICFFHVSNEMDAGLLRKIPVYCP